MVGESTRRVERHVFRILDQWLGRQIRGISLDALLEVPPLLDLVVAHWGYELYEQDRPMYLFVHLVTALQRYRRRLRQSLVESWALIRKWELAEPVCHRRPLPVALWKAMVVLAVMWQWPRLAGALLFTFSAPCRVGEYLRSSHRNFSLPRDFLEESGAAYLEVRQPKTAGRGGARTQHARVTDVQAVRFLDGLLGELPAAEPLYPLSSSAFRRRWDRLLRELGVPPQLRVTPGSLRGGGAVAAYRQGSAISDILWRMRLRSVTSLEFYLQEVAADSVMRDLPTTARDRIAGLQTLFDFVLDHILSRVPG